MTKSNGGAWYVAARTAPAILKGNLNAVYSPVCICEGLRVMRMGADGVSAREIDELLGAEKAEDDWVGLRRVDKWSYEGYKAHLANGVWLDKKAEPATSFTERCRVEDVFLTTIELSAPGAGEQISQWISDKTEGLLAPVIELEPETFACVASALYFKDAWRDEFLKQMTKRDVFRAEDGEIYADYMTREADALVADVDFGVIVGLPLSNGASMLFALPNEDVTLANLIADGSLLEAVRDFDPRLIDVELHVPKFTCETTAEDVSAALVQAGFSTAKAPDLSSMTGCSAMPAHYAHGAKVTIDEEGFEGGAYFVEAACAGALPEDWVPPTPRVITLDRPFAYVLVSRVGQPLFVGTVCSPKADPYAWLPFGFDSEEDGEDGCIIEGEEIPGVCRITLEEGVRATYVVACDICGAMAHTVFAEEYDEAMGKYEGMKQDLAEYARLLDGEAFDLGGWCEGFVGRWT